MSLSRRDKHALVQSLWTSWNNGRADLERLPKAIDAILDTEAWRDREVDGKRFENATFREFVVSPPLKGCGWENQTDAIDRVLGLKAPDTLTRWREAMTGTQGTRNDLALHNNIMKSRQGTSLGYTLDRLKRDHGKLYARVIAGELSANAAAIEAGFRKKPKHKCAYCGRWS